MKKALITGITGQDGSYLAELLLSKEYDVHGMVRRTSTFNRERIDHLKKKVHLHYADLEDTSSICRIVKIIQPDEIYHLAAMSHVQISSDMPEYTFDTNAQGTTRLLEAVRLSETTPRIYNAATSELFGGCNEGELLTEESAFRPKSPYAISKLYGYWTMRHYRDAYGLKTWNGILFNHESPRRGENFITRKISLSIAKILSNKQKYLEVGNIEARRDWGYAPDYVKAMWMMLQTNNPDDYVIATGETHSVKEFIQKAFFFAGIENWKRYTKINRSYVRRVDVNCLCGDATKAFNMFGWKPKVKFESLVEIMVRSDMEKEGLVK